MQVLGFYLDVGHGLEEIGVVDGRNEGEVVVVKFLQPSARHQKYWHPGCIEVIFLLGQQQQILELLPYHTLHLHWVHDGFVHLNPIVSKLLILLILIFCQQLIVVIVVGVDHMAADHQPQNVQR